MGTLSITASGFAALPVSAPANWPAGIVWPGSGSPNGTKAYTINDADWIALLTWTASSQAVPVNPTAPQILLVWVQLWINGTRSAVQQFFTTPPSVPPTITVT